MSMQWTKQFSGSAFLKPLFAVLAMLALVSGCGSEHPDQQPGGSANPYPTLSLLASSEVSQPAAGQTTALQVRIQFSNPAPAAGSISVATTSDTARAGTHYSTFNDAVTFAEGASSAQFSVDILDGNGDTEDVSFQIQLTGAVNALLGSSTTQTVTIYSTTEVVDPVNQASLSLPQNLSLRAPRVGRGSIEYPIVFTLSEPSPVAGEIKLRTVEGSAEAGVNFEAFDHILPVAAGAREVVFSITLMADANQAEDLEFSLLAETATNVQLPTTRTVPVTVINVNDETAGGVPSILWPSVTDLYEPTSGSATFNLLLPFSAPASQAGSFRLATQSATALAGEHFQAFSEQIDFVAGDTEVLVPVTVMRTPLGMTEPLSFYLQISSATNVTLPNTRDLELTILPVSVSTPATAELQLQPMVEVPEPFSDASPVTYSLMLPLSMPAPTAGSVRVRSVDDTALAGRNYTAISDQAVTFAEGDENLYLDIEILFDSLGAEGKEFTLEFYDAEGIQLPESRSMSISIRASGLALPVLETPATITFQRPDDGTSFDVQLVLPFDRAAILAGSIELAVNQGSAIENRDFTGILPEYSFAKHDDEIVVDFTLVGSNYADDRQFTLVVTKANNMQLGSSTEERTITVIIEAP
ncbi:hypothetical protein AKK86_05975 [Idiomarina sp. FenBw--71]|nr:hypothetical protein [Idiomarina sp. FeN1]NCU57319.1 hypothetical protein [Idiomarina sp. FenA--70]NCU60027.1 hypothetical protein [Idiomarina sp. FenBw--71]